MKDDDGLRGHPLRDRRRRRHDHDQPSRQAQCVQGADVSRAALGVRSGVGRSHRRRRHPHRQPETAAFCTGGDVSVRTETGYDGADSKHDIGLDIEDVHSIIRDIPKPVIAAVNGYAIGGGHVLHVICDLTIAADTARFGQVGPKVGSVDPGFGTAYLARVVGEKKAREIWYLCEQYSAEECREMGLVNKVVPAAELMDTARAWASTHRVDEPDGDQVGQAVLQHGHRVDPRRRDDGAERRRPVLRHRRGSGGAAGVHREAPARLPPVPSRRCVPRLPRALSCRTS